MRTNFIVSLLLIVSSTLVAQNLRTEVPFEIGFEGGYYIKGSYNEVYEQPTWIEYTKEFVPCALVLERYGGCRYQRKHEGEKPLNFHTKSADALGIKTSTNEDYCYTENPEKKCGDINNIYDRGHLAPSLHFSYNRKAQDKTYDYLNISLQHSKLNKGPIRDLEEYIFNIPHDVVVRIHIRFKKDGEILSTGAKVPSAYDYELHYNGYTEIYHFPNKVPEYENFKSYLRHKYNSLFA